MVEEKTIETISYDRKSNRIKWIRELVALIFWFYVITKLFIFDIDILILSKIAPQYLVLLNYKLFFFMALIAFVWGITKNGQILIWFLYIIFYPIIIIVWKIPLYIYKQNSGILICAYINSLIYFVKSVKYNFIISTSFVILIVLILSFVNSIILSISVIALLIILIVIYINRIMLIFKPSVVFQFHKQLFSNISKYIKTSFCLDEQLKNMPRDKFNENQQAQWMTNLQLLVLFNRLCFFFSKKLREYQNSGFTIMSEIFALFILILITIFSFATINYGLFKIDNQYFQYTNEPTFFIFFYYSFKQLIFSSINELIPIATITQSISILESFFAFFLASIFISLILNTKHEIYNQELNQVIFEAQQSGYFIESFIKDDYRLDNIEAALAELDNIKAGFVGFIYHITNRLEE